MKSKLKHPYMLLFFLSLSVPLFQECRDEKALNKGENQGKPFEIIQDRDFKNGLAITGNSSFHPEPIGYLYPFGKSGKETNWVLAQWGTRNILNDINPITSNDTVIYQQEAKRLFFYPQNNGNTLIGLEVFASTEYSAPRKEGESWVHLLIEQVFSTPIRLSTYNSIDCKIKARLLFCKNKIGDDYVKDLHTAQITLYLGIQNKTKDSPKYGDFF